jgi:hypothetical protein
MTLASSRARRAAPWTLALAAVLMVQVAAAQEPDAATRLAARDLAVAGAEAFDQRDYATALDRFKRAESLYKVPSIAVMIARCLGRLGRVVEAVDKYEETLRMPLDASAPAAFLRAVADAKVEVDAEQARLARLELNLPADAPPSTQVLLDGKRVPAALLGVATPVDPGTHRVEASAPGREPYRIEVTLGEGGRQTLQIALDPARPAAPALAGPASSASDRGARPSTLGIALLAGGAVALAGGSVTGVIALNRQATLDAACSPGCPPSMSSELDSFRLNRTLSYVGFGVGLAAAGVGTYLLLHQSSSGGQLGVAVGLNGASLDGRF